MIHNEIKKKLEVTTYNVCGIIKTNRFIPHRIPHDLRYNSNNFQRFPHIFFFAAFSIFYFSLNSLICYLVRTTLLFDKNLKRKKNIKYIALIGFASKQQITCLWVFKGIKFFDNVFYHLRNSIRKFLTTRV